MKKILSLLLFLNFTILSSQSFENLKTETNNFYAAHYNMDFNGITTSYHPNYFEKITKEELTSKLDEQFQNDITGIRFIFPTMNFTFGAIQEIDGEKYCVITFKNLFRINMVNKVTENQVKLELAAYKEVQNYKSVKFEPNRNSYFIEEYVTWIAVASPNTQNKWKFIEKVPKFNSFDKLLAPEIQKQLGL